MLLLVVVLALTFIALLEFNRIGALISGGSGGGLFPSLIGLVPSICVYRNVHESSSAILIAAFFIFLFTALRGVKNFRQTLPHAALKTMGLIYISLPLSYFILFSQAPLGRWWILLFLVIIWCNDTFAYIFGKLFGRHKLCVSISPGKTIEGAAGGIASGIVAALVFNAACPLSGYRAIILIAIVTGVLGIAGDLSESVMKRAAGVKDSGTIVPGHGGILDRIDSMFFSLPAIYMLAIYL